MISESIVFVHSFLADSECMTERGTKLVFVDDPTGKGFVNSVHGGNYSGDVGQVGRKESRCIFKYLENRLSRYSDKIVKDAPLMP